MGKDAMQSGDGTRGKDMGNRMDDLISRKAAIAVADSVDYIGLSVEDCKRVTDVVVKELKQLPSIESERLTDKEQRIFLAAMSREEKVCKEVDPNGDHLLVICREIKRKVKGALWT